MVLAEMGMLKGFLPVLLGVVVVVGAVGAAGVGVWGRWGALLYCDSLEGCLGVVPDAEAEWVVFGILMWWWMR